jgi:hypothetical protein
MQKKHLSVIIPTHQEKSDSWLKQMAVHYPRGNGRIQYLVVDHDTPSILFNSLDRDDFEVVTTHACTRAAKLQLGIERSQGEWVLCHHPRSVIELGGLESLLATTEGRPHWGGFTHSFDKRHWGLAWTSFYSNQVRPRLSSILYLDHCIYFHKSLLDRPIPDIPIFEDTELCKILRRHSRPQRLKHQAVTSCIRFEKNGFWRQAALNQILKIRYYMGSSFQDMNDLYEDKLHLNG